MAGATKVAPWKPIAGTGQSLGLSSGASAAFTNAVGLQTYAVYISLAPAATAAGAIFKLSQAGTAASATLDILVKTTDPPLLVGCAPGDKITGWGLAAGLTAYIVELTQ